MYWEAPKQGEQGDNDPIEIKGMPEDAVYPLIKAYNVENMTEALAEQIYRVPGFPQDQKIEIKNLIRAKMSMWRRVIGWSLNDCEPGHQLDVILRR